MDTRNEIAPEADYSAILKKAVELITIFKNEIGIKGEFSKKKYKIFLDAMNLLNQVPYQHWVTEVSQTFAAVFMHIFAILLDKHQNPEQAFKNISSAHQDPLSLFTEFCRHIEAHNETADWQTSLTIAITQAYITHILISPEGISPEKKIEIYTQYCLKGDNSLDQCDEKQLRSLYDRFLSLIISAHLCLASAHLRMGDMARCHSHLFSSIMVCSMLKTVGDEHLFLIKKTYQLMDMATPTVTLHNQTPLGFLHNVYKGEAEFSEFAASYTLCKREPADSIILKFFLQGLAMIEQHLAAGLLPESGFTRDMQHAFFRNTFNAYHAELKSGYLSLQGLMKNSTNVQAAMAMKITNLETRVSELETELNEFKKRERPVSHQGLFADGKKKARSLETLQPPSLVQPDRQRRHK